MMKRFWNWLRIPLHTLALAGAFVPVVWLAIFIARYAASYPTADMVALNLPLALAIREGTFTLSDLMQPYLGHRHLFTTLTTAILVALTDWDLRYEFAVVYVLALVNVGLVVAVLRRVVPAAWLMVPAAWLMLAVQLGDTWLIPHNMWFHSTFFALMTIWAAAGRVGGRYAVGWVLVGCGGALLALSNGLTVFGVALVVMWLSGRYRRHDYVIFSGVSAVILALYLLNAPFSATSADNPASVSLPPLLTLVHYLLIYTGAPFAARDLMAAAWIGAAGLALTVLHIAVIWRRDGRGTAAAPAGLVVFALGSGVLIAAGRVQIGVESALYERYQVLSVLLWVGLVALMLWALRERVHLALTLMNAVALALMGAGYAFTAYTLTPTTFEANFEDGFPLVALDPFFDCVALSPITRNYGCQEIPPEQLDKLAAYNLTGYARRDAVNILDGYVPGERVIVAADSAWENVHARDWLLDGVLETDIIHLMPPDAETTVNTYFDNIPTLPDDIRYTGDFPIEGERVWTLTRGATPPAPSGYALSADSPAPYGFTVRRYERLTLSGDTLATFDNLTLRAWGIVGDPVACTPVTLRTTWEAAAPLPDNLKLTFVATDAGGVGIARADAPLIVAPERWQPNIPYIDRRTLTLPCEGATLNLMLGVYYETESGVEPVGELFYLTTISPPAP